MEYIVKFGNRDYIFYSQSDIFQATMIYEKGNKNLNEFENELEIAEIEFDYEFELGLPD